MTPTATNVDPKGYRWYSYADIDGNGQSVTRYARFYWGGGSIGNLTCPVGVSPTHVDRKPFFDPEAQASRV